MPLSPCPAEFREIQVPSSLDDTLEPSLLFIPEGPVQALCVGLHTWSFDRFDQAQALLPFCRSRGWALVLPEFRGPNHRSNPRVHQAGGSAHARRDVIDATRWVMKLLGETLPVFLLGKSGGGHLTLLTAARESFAWTAVSAWCPITDLAAWHREKRDCAAWERVDSIEAVCGGAPGASAEVDHEYALRSSITDAAALSRIRLQLAHGRHDDVVSYHHSWNLAQKIEEAGSDSFYFHVFNGGHDLWHEHAFHFFDQSLQGS